MHGRERILARPTAAHPTHISTIPPVAPHHLFGGETERPRERFPRPFRQNGPLTRRPCPRVCWRNNCPATSLEWKLSSTSPSESRRDQPVPLPQFFSFCRSQASTVFVGSTAASSTCSLMIFPDLSMRKVARLAVSIGTPWISNF